MRRRLVEKGGQVYIHTFGNDGYEDYTYYKSNGVQMATYIDRPYRVLQELTPAKEIDWDAWKIIINTLEEQGIIG